MSFDSFKLWVQLLRDIGLIIAVPGLSYFGYIIFNRHIQALKDSHKAHIDALESENRLLKETQYDRALSLIKAEKRLFQIERENLKQEIDKLRLENDTQTKVAKVIDSRNRAIEHLFETLSKKELRHIEVESWEEFLDESISEASLWLAMQTKSEESD